MLITEKNKTRFWNKVEKTESCWIWTAGLGKDGYGKFSLGKGEDRRTFRAHRFSYLLTKGSPEGSLVCHTCDNPKCVNPEHLFLGSVMDNNRDAIRKGRANKARGEKLSDLTEEQVKDIRTRVNNGETQVSVAKRHNINKKRVWHIIHDTWKHI